MIIVGVILSCLSSWLGEGASSMLSLIAMFYPIFLLFLIGFILFWMIVKPKYMWASVFTVLLSWGPLMSFVNINSSKTLKPSETLSVASFNSQAYYSSSTKLSKENDKRIQKFREFIEGFGDLDIICLQESWKYVQGVFSAVYSEHEKFYSGGNGLVIFSRYPIIDQGEIIYEKKAYQTQWVDVFTGIDTIRVYNLHLQSNYITGIADKVIEDPDLQQKETWSGVKSILSSYVRFNQFRVAQAKRIREHLNEVNHPVLICGDFNDGPLSNVVSILGNGMKDTFKDKGNGIGTTYAGSIPLLRIDNIFVDPRFDVLSHKVLRKKFSDHYPIKATLNLNSTIESE